MLDLNYFRHNLSEIVERLALRGVKFDAEHYQQLEQNRKACQTEQQQLQNSRNNLSKQIGAAKKQGLDASALMTEVGQINERLRELDITLDETQSTLRTIHLSTPNLTQADVPTGKSEEDNLEISRWGEIPKFDFVVQDHVALGEALGMMDFEAATKIASTRFVVLKGGLARLQRALIQFMLDTHIHEHGYEELYVPYMANPDSLYGTAQLPKFAEDQFQVMHEPSLYLIPTAEVPVTNLARDRIFEASELPKRYVCHTSCFRSEAGSYGRDTRGMIRQHQFEKVELVQFTTPELSNAAHETLTHHAQVILQKLGLPYRVVSLCTGDIGFAAAKTYDLEVWLPSQNKYREISSCSNFEAYQARRMQARWRNPQTQKPEPIHTLNGSGLAVGRTLIALMENFQDAQGNIHLPEILWPYMGGIKVISM